MVLDNNNDHYIIQIISFLVQRAYNCTFILWQKLDYVPIYLIYRTQNIWFIFCTTKSIIFSSLYIYIYI
jgi:hypothetical protein